MFAVQLSYITWDASGNIKMFFFFFQLAYKHQLLVMYTTLTTILVVSLAS